MNLQRETELIGLTDDGRLVLWSHGLVEPSNRFVIGENGRIASGHYVIDWCGVAVTVHLANATECGIVAVQFMCGSLDVVYMPLGAIEDTLLGRVLPDPMKKAKIRGMLHELQAIADAGNSSPHRQRGHFA